ncbi:hypothetical protein ABT025_23480 [Streptomyces sp. NPDC002809]|uniref:hypothetical protein n=1 Tax=Streptomyces sp. NPDC002809 TaxID=3154433 RepID=UPI00332196B2
MCMPNGIVDLRTGEVRAADPLRDFNSCSTGIGPRAIPTPRFFRFLTDTFDDDVLVRRASPVRPTMGCRIACWHHGWGTPTSRPPSVGT